MIARIYQPAKTAMQSGMAKTKKWILEFVPSASSVKQRSDSLTGWVSAAETMTQVRLKFDSLDDAKAYAEKQGLAYRVAQPHKRKTIRKSYSDNFRHDRTGAWTH